MDYKIDYIKILFSTINNNTNDSITTNIRIQHQERYR